MTPHQQRVLSILKERSDQWTRRDQIADLLDSTPGSIKVAISRLRRQHGVNIITDGYGISSRGYRLA